MKIFLMPVLLFLASLAFAEIKSDTVPTSAGDLQIYFVGHGTLYFQWDGKTVHVDPWSRLTDYAALPKADIILITHQHGDHLDPDAVKAIRTDQTVVLLTAACTDKVSGEVMKNGDEKTIAGIKVKAVPAYNIKNVRAENQPFHPKGEGNGYVITFGDKSVYVAGDTENVPEMAELKGQIDIAFLPMNLPYTMTPEMTADAARLSAPKILYPYHYGDTDVQKLVDLLKDDKVEIRIREMK